MLSTETPPPSSLSPEISQPESGILGSHGRVSGGSQHQLEIDLWRSGPVDGSPVPKFSIRDYVFNVRGKGIENHWPFCPKNLQLCLNRGAKDVLPPFQALDSVKNSSTESAASENIDSSDVNPSSFRGHVLSFSSDDSVGEKLPLDIEDIKSIEEDKENPSSTTSHCCSYINSVGITDSLPEAENLLQSSAEKPEFLVHHATHKVVSNPQNLVNSRLIVKLRDIAEQKPSEELLVNTLVVPEAMASKVCPVCKMFSSSSNTTLNAHIDQCLSGEPSAKLATNSKVMKHRIKPRKTRSMADIYATSICCTLDDLDRRNGTNWALNFGFPTQEDMEVCADEKNISTLSVGSKDNHDNGAMYFDSNGTKLRILSKTGKMPSDLNGKDDYNHEKLVKKKKKHLVCRYDLLKCPPGKQSCSSKLGNCLEVSNGSGQKFHPEEDKKEGLSQPSEVCDQMNTDELGLIKQWVGSTRTDPKKINREQQSQCLSKAIKNPRGNGNLPLLRPRKREGYSSVESRFRHGKRNSLVFSECNVKQLKKVGPSVLKRRMGPLSGTEYHLPYQNDKSIRCACPDTSGDSSFVGSRMLQHDAITSKGKNFESFKTITSNRAVLSEGMKLSSLRNNLQSVGNASLPQPKKKLGKIHSDFKKRRLRHKSGYNDAAVLTPGGKAVQMLEPSPKLLKDRAKVLKTQRQGFSDSGEEGGMVLRNSEASTESDSHGKKNTYSFPIGNVLDGSSNGPGAVKVVEIKDEFDCDLSSNLSARKAFMTFGEALDSGFPGLTGSDGSERYIKAYEEHSPVDQVFHGEQEIFCADKLGKGSDASNAPFVAEIDSSNTRGSYFLNVDVITIPGPPGSFLPSPGRAGSEELHGNSSLTTCRIHSSEEEHELVDMDSSDSPLSAASFASNSIAGRPNSTSTVNLTEQSFGVQHGISEDRMDTVVENFSIPFEHAAGADGKPKLDESNDCLIFPISSHHAYGKALPCCCCRKEEVIQNSSFNYQQLELPGRRTLTSIPMLPPSQETEIIRDPNDELYPFNMRSETLPEKEPTLAVKKVAVISPTKHDAAFVPHSSEAMLATCGDSESPSLSTTGSVLRLMGKNLTVVNKEENLSLQAGMDEKSMADGHPSLQSNIIPNGSKQNAHHSFCHDISQDSSVHAIFQKGVPVQCIDFSSLDGFRIHASFRVPELSPPPTRVMFSGKSFGESSTLTLKCHEYTDRCKFTPDTKIKTDLLANGASFGIKATDNEANLDAGSSVRIAAPRASGHGLSDANPFYRHQTPCFPINGESHQMSQTASTRAPPSKGMDENNTINSNPVSGGTSVLHPGSLTSAASPSIGHQRSSSSFSSCFSIPKNFSS